MSTNLPIIIAEKNLSFAWGRAFMHVISRSNKNLSPLIVSIEDFTNNRPIEDIRMREKLDEHLRLNDKNSSAVSAMLIFPLDFWNRLGRPNICDFSKNYIANYLPRLKARNRRNTKGVYFERMIAFQGTKKKGGIASIKTKNQLKHITDIWHRDKEYNKHPRLSALQVSCFDPVKDHTGSAQAGFPCLQQVSFAYDNAGGLAVNAYYPTQYIFDRAYGNYLGLCHLGEFMAHHLGLKMLRLNCYIGHPKLGGITKRKIEDLISYVQKRLPKTSS